MRKWIEYFKNIQQQVGALPRWLRILLILQCAVMPLLVMLALQGLVVAMSAVLDGHLEQNRWVIEQIRAHAFSAEAIQVYTRMLGSFAHTHHIMSLLMVTLTGAGVASSVIGMVIFMVIPIGKPKTRSPGLPSNLQQAGR